ncbi:MAG: 6-phosphogluconolactonase, partial [Vulcanococcus sp.]
MTSPTYQLDVLADAELLARRCAERIASLIDLALDERDRAQIALSGGGTPAAAYRLLNREHLPWNRVDVVLGDERWVPATDPASKAGMLAQTLLAALELEGSADAEALLAQLTTYPIKGALDPVLPTDPLLYRFYEIL